MTKEQQRILKILWGIKPSLATEWELGATDYTLRKLELRGLIEQAIAPDGALCYRARLKP